MAVRPVRWIGACVLVLGLSGCGSGGDSSAPEAPSTPAADTDEPGTPSPSDVHVLHATDAGVKTTGSFDRIDGGPQAESAQVLRSVGDGTASAVFATAVPRTGYYELSLRWPQPEPLPAAVAVEVRHRLGTAPPTRLDQGAAAGQWNAVGVFPFEAAGDGAVVLHKVPGATLVVDAIRLVWQGETAPPLAIVDEELPVGEVSERYSGRLRAQGGVAPHRWSIASGTLPPGISLDASGTLSGRPSRAGSFTPAVQVRDAAGTVAQAALHIEIVAATDPAPEDPPPEDPPPAAPGADLRALTEIVRTMPEGEWRRVNLNAFSDAWPPVDLRPDHYGNPAAIIRAWSSFAWDSNRGNLILYGGGHANYSGNDVYFWRGATRRWERASLPSEIRQDRLGHWHAVDGPFNAPASAHTYDNSVFLPIVDRFLTLGGAAFNGGSSYRLENEPGRTGPYFFDPNRADPMKVGGTTGSHVRRGGSHPEIVGGRMWSNRDAFRNGRLQMDGNFVNGCTAYAEENGKDVVYVRQIRTVFRYTVHDVHDPRKDTWEPVGRFWDGPGSKAVCAYDPVRRLFVRTGSQAVPFVFWDLNTPGPDNRDRNVVSVDPSGRFERQLARGEITIRDCGLDFDRPRARFALWCGGGRVWMLTPPSTPSTEGWVLTAQRTPAGAVPSTEVGTGILGKWKYAPNLDAFVALQGNTAGNVWIYKPVGWRDPAH